MEFRLKLKLPHDATVPQLKSAIAGFAAGVKGDKLLKDGVQLGPVLDADGKQIGEWAIVK